ncbi:MAG: hypothetical protein WD960_09880 [Gemmatimonadota bacterium]
MKNDGWIACAALLLAGGFQAIPLEAQERSSAQEIFDRMLAAYDPPLMQEAEARGLWDREQLPVLREMNPWFLKGDFDGDGALDVAFWVRDPETDQAGVAIVHATLDALRVFGAGQPAPPPSDSLPTELLADTWHVRPAGDVEDHPFTDVPEIGVEYGVPFTFRRDTLEFVFLARSAFVFHWAEGRYWKVWTAD